MFTLGCDLGQSSLKLVGTNGSLQFASTAALFSGMVSDFGFGPRRRKPLVVEGDHGKLWVGQDAHSYGTPVENIDFERLTGNTEMRYILYGALSEYMRQFGSIDEPVRLIVGLPFQMLQGDEAVVTKYRGDVTGWMLGGHTWETDKKPQHIEVGDVRLLPQALGAPVDYAMTMDGKPVDAERQKTLTFENGTINVGSSTVETLVIDGKKNQHVFNGGKRIGVYQLWQRVDPRQAYSFGEFESKLRQGALPEDMQVEPHLESWYGEVIGFVNSKWKESWRRFHRVFLVGGGSILLERYFKQRFNGKAVMMDDPVMSVARGLYKFGFGIREK